VAPGTIFPKEDQRLSNGNDWINEQNMYDIAKKRFNIDKERETVKLR
jgi:hypothetical protein